MLRLESSAIGEFIGSTMLLAIVDRLVDLDVSLYIFVRYFIREKISELVFGFLKVEIAWDDILHEDFSKGIFEMELEDLGGQADDPRSDGDEVTLQLRILILV